MTTISFKSPKDIVEGYIIQVSELFDKHSPKIRELFKLSDEADKNKDISDKEKYGNMKNELIKKYRQEHRKICEQFEIKLTKHNFSETLFCLPSYAYHRVRSVETISPTKIKIFTRVPRKKKGTCVFYLDLIKEKWTITKYRYIDWEGKEAATEW
jgi:hypothetical protein